MFATSRLLQHTRITLFTRATCGLCAQAKGVLSNVWDQRPFVYTEIDVDKTEVKTWKELYDYDVPVVSSPIFLLPFTPNCT
jgi:glutaredoxin